MRLGEAVRVCLLEYAVVRGRARRSEYWWFALFNVLVGIAAALVDMALSTSVVETVVALALTVPSITVGVRRLHDIDRSGWWTLLVLVPVVGWIVLLVWASQDGTPFDNSYGPSPKPALLPR